MSVDHDFPLKALKGLHIPPGIKTKFLTRREDPKRSCPASAKLQLIPLSIETAFQPSQQTTLASAFGLGTRCSFWFEYSFPRILQGSLLCLTIQPSKVASFKNLPGPPDTATPLLAQHLFSKCLFCFLMTYIYSSNCSVHLFKGLLPVFNSRRKASLGQQPHLLLHVCIPNEGSSPWQLNE